MKKNYIFLLFTSLLSLVAFGQIEQVLDINDGASNSAPNNLFVFNGALYFGADDSGGTNTPGAVDLGRELWTSDGTAAGTSFVSDLRTGDASSSPGNFFELNGTMYFSANSGAGNVLHSSDGTTAGTIATGGSFVFNPLELGGLIYYINTTDANSLYQFDGTTQVKAANSGTDDVQFIGGAFTSLNNKIIGYGETTTDEPTTGRELYEYDPATDTYTLILDISAGNANSGISNFVSLGTDVYFEATGKVWKTDGTTAGTTAVAIASTINSTSQYFVWNGSLYFEGDDGSNDQLWKYDPITDTVLNVSNITGSTATGGNNHDPSDYAAFGGFLYYAGEISDNTSQYLFRTDGIYSVRLDANIADIDEIVELNGFLYFEGDDGVTGNELYRLNPATLSIDRVSFNNVKIYPNPSINQITVDGNFTSPVNYTISDINGRTVLKGELTNNTIKHNLNTGIYLLQLNIENSSITKKIIVN
ncbi:MAG: hypothetical protein DA407_14590 [Bacteroidetes bacterium]|nr:MAG: hypothetical protein DA407_14590 [Bacteroidota bacterium]